MAPIGKALIIFGLVIAVLGAIVWISSSIPFLGRLPGDIYIRRGNFTFYFPLATCIILSIIISILFALMRR
jgi:predicted phosphohydrolase